MMSLRYALIFGVTSVLFFASCKDKPKLLIYGHREATTVKHPDGTTSIDTVYQTISDFSFLNQDSTIINNATFKDKIYIADFFFTTCPSICPIMHRNMKTIYDDYKENPDVMFLSHTIDYKYDKPSVLKKYAEKLGVDGKKWEFAYGTKDAVYKLAETAYLSSVIEDSKVAGGYVHQGYFILVDKDRHIRGLYDGTNDEAVAQLKKDIPVLLAEYKQ